MAKPMTQAELADVLRTIATLIEQGDSFEGSISYRMPDWDQGEPRNAYAMVEAAFRTGNSLGQGGMALIQ